MKDGEPFAMAGLWEQWDKGEDAAGNLHDYRDRRQFADEADPRPEAGNSTDDTWDHWLTAKDLGIPTALLILPG